MTQYVFPSGAPRDLSSPLNAGSQQAPFVLPVTEQDDESFANISAAHPLPAKLPASMTDTFSEALVVISEPHHMIHSGFAFHCSAKSGSIADEGVYEVLLKVPALAFPHWNSFRWAAGGGDIDLEFFEGPTTTDDGSGLAEINLNRNSSVTADLALFAGPTVSVDGTLLSTHWSPPTATGVGQTQEGTNAVNGEEWLLKPSTDYLLRWTNNSGDGVVFWFEARWYEIG